MKNKKIITKVLVVLAACFMFASFSPSLDGRAVVVDSGVFPQGLFAKTVGYLPGDIISVANITGETTVDLLVIGALDPSEGVAIMLSPEAADAIGIDKDANNIVKITKRSGQDERVYGTAIIAKQNSTDAALDEEPVIKEESEEAFEVEPAKEAFEEEDLEEETKDFEDFSEESEKEEAPVEETAVDEEAVEQDEEIPQEEAEDESEEEIEEEYVEEESDVEPESEEEIEEEFIEEDESDYEEEFVDESEEDDEEEPLDEENPEEESEENLEEIAEPFDEEAAEEASYEEEYDEPENEDFEAEDENEAIEETVDEEKYVDAEEEVEEDIPALPYDEPVETEVEDEIAYDDAAEDDIDAIIESELEEYDGDVDVEEYEAIVLVPADSVPPVNEYVEEDEVEDVIDETTNAEEVDTVPEVVIEAVPSPAPVVDEPVKETRKVEETKTTASYDKYMVGGLSDLKSGKYYIQIAALSQDDNIMEIVNKYGKNYPITIVPMAGGIRKQVLIGPLSMDEYAVVLERFKSYGYKDAFLRKIK